MTIGDANRFLSHSGTEDRTRRMYCMLGVKRGWFIKFQRVD